MAPDIKPPNPVLLEFKLGAFALILPVNDGCADKIEFKVRLTATLCPYNPAKTLGSTRGSA